MCCCSDCTPDINSFFTWVCKTTTNQPRAGGFVAAAARALQRWPCWARRHQRVLLCCVTYTKKAVVVINLSSAVSCRFHKTIYNFIQACYCCCLPGTLGCCVREGFIGSTFTVSKYQHFYQPPSSSLQSSDFISAPPLLFCHQLDLISL